MSEDKTTKQILEEDLKGRKRTPLYNPELLKSMTQDFEQQSELAGNAADHRRF